MKFSLYVNGDITASLGKGNEAEILKETGKMEKSYVIDNTAYRNIVSACVKMVKIAQNKPVFLKDTFSYYPEELEAQKIFTALLKNTKKTYKMKYYVWVKEHGTKKGKLHYHLIADIPFTDIKLLQNSFNRAIRNVRSDVICSNNSIRLPPARTHRSIVSNGVRMAKYIGSYISKERGRKWKSRCFAISHDLFPLSLAIDNEVAVNLLQNNEYFKSVEMDYCSVTHLKNFYYFRYFT